MLQGVLLSCYRSKEEWDAAGEPAFTVDCLSYTVVKTFDANFHLTIALVPIKAFEESYGTRDANGVGGVPKPPAEKSWYLCSHPATNQQATAEWFAKLEAVCAKPTKTSSA